MQTLKVSYGVIGMLDRIREPRAGVAPPRCEADPTTPSLLLEAVGVSSTSRRNRVLFIVVAVIVEAVS